jgi:50S ribosomal subunit-associated GTPase HflX
LPNQSWDVQDELEELATLAATVGVEVVGSRTQKLDHPHPATFVGKGKLEEIKELQETLGYDFVLFDGELTPAQLRNLEKVLDVKVTTGPLSSSMFSPAGRRHMKDDCRLSLPSCSIACRD